MKTLERRLVCLFLSLVAACAAFVTEASATSFTDKFLDRTLRVDYNFCGNSSSQSIYLNSLWSSEGWFGRRVNLDSMPLKGNGEVVMTDFETGEKLYVWAFSSLFTEWLSTDESHYKSKSFEHTVLLPLPKAKAVVTARLFNKMGEAVCENSFVLDPADILIRSVSPSECAWKYLHRGGDSRECIDIVILAEGYSKKEMKKFHTDALTACESLLAAAPFSRKKSQLNIIEVDTISEDSGVSEPLKGEWRTTAVASHFSTFYSDRYLTTERVFQIHNLLGGIPYEHIIILANTPTYGGGGIFNSYTLTTAHHSAFRPVVVHEFGHSFGGLADEYFYDFDDVLDESYDTAVEPWEPNITTLVDFPSKWQDMLPSGTPVPTPGGHYDTSLLDNTQEGIDKIGVYEGGGYMLKGVYRPSDNCRMRTNAAAGFCPVCRRALSRLIDFYTKEAE